MRPCNFPKYVSLTEEVNWDVIFNFLEAVAVNILTELFLNHRKQKDGVNYVSSTFLSEESKKHFNSALIPDMMSSEDKQEDENGSRYFVIRKPKFQTRKFEKLLKTIDDAYKANCSQRAKDQTVWRETGEESGSSKPKFSDENLSKLFIQ